MQLTPEQQTRLAQAKSAGEKRVALSFTPQQKAEWEAAVQQELAGKEENLDRLRKIKAAAEQGGSWATFAARSPFPEDQFKNWPPRSVLTGDCFPTFARATRSCRPRPWTGWSQPSVSA